MMRTLGGRLYKVRLLGVLGLVPVVACAAGAASARQGSELQRQIDQLRHQASRDQSTIRDLENRLFVLEDKLATARVEMGKKPNAVPTLPELPELPVVKREPISVVQAPRVPAGHLPPLYQDGDIEVVYEGEAARSSREPPVLSLDESGVKRRHSYGRSAPTARRPFVDDPGLPDPADVTDRLVVTSSLPRPISGGARPATSGDDPIALYKDAYAALTAHQHDPAKAGFRRFLAKWPNHDYADNAQYWLGEAFYDQRDYAAALAEFRRVVKLYPSGNKAPDALLKIGYCHAKLGDLEAARDVLSQVVEIYPQTTSAKLAAKRLEEL